MSGCPEARDALRWFLACALMVPSLALAQPEEDAAAEEAAPMAADVPAEGGDGAARGDGAAAAGGGDGAAGGGAATGGGGAGGAAAPMAPPPDDDEEGDDSHLETESGLLSDEQALAEERMGREEARSGTDPYEDPALNYYFLGFFYHHHFTPQFILNLFTDDSTAANNPALGLEFTYRKDEFDIVVRGWYQQYHVDGPFRAAGDPEEDVEIVVSDLQTAFVGATFLWGTQFNDIIGLQYGIGIGIGGVWGDVVRTEARPAQAGEPGTNGFVACSGPNDMRNPRYCEDSMATTDDDRAGHYNFVASKWNDGGSVPLLWFRVAPQLSLRIKPIKQLLFRADVGFDLFSGFFVGGSVAYGFGG